MGDSVGVPLQRQERRTVHVVKLEDIDCIGVFAANDQIIASFGKLDLVHILQVHFLEDLLLKFLDTVGEKRVDHRLVAHSHAKVKA